MKADETIKQLEEAKSKATDPDVQKSIQVKIDYLKNQKDVTK